MIDLPLPIVGTKVLIRNLDPEDPQSLYELEIDEDVKRYVGGPLTTSRQDWIERTKRPDAVLPLIVTWKTTGDIVGRASLSRVAPFSQSWKIQALIVKKYWGQRLNREVTELLMRVIFDDLEACSVIAIVLPQNEASLALVEKLGFTRVGTKRSDGWDN